MSVDNYAHLILGLPYRDLDLTNVAGCAYEDGHGVEDMEYTMLRISRDNKTDIECVRSNRGEWYIGIQLAHTRSYGMCEVPTFDLVQLTQMFKRLFGKEPKLWLIERQS